MMDLSKMSRKDVAKLKDSYGTMDANNTFNVEKVCVDDFKIDSCVACNLEGGWAIYNPVTSRQKGTYLVDTVVELIKEGEVVIHFTNGNTLKKTP